MTMFSAENRQFFGGDIYGKGFCTMSQMDGDDCLGSDLVVCPSSMAENESKNDEKPESSSRDDQEEWLQLSIGGHKNDDSKKGSGLIELELLPRNSNNDNNNSHSHMTHMRPLCPMPENRAPRQLMNFASPFFLQQNPSGSNSTTTSSLLQQQEINWGYRPSIGISLPSFSTPSSSYFSRRPFQLFTGVDVGPGPAIDFRVIQTPKRPHSGLWFMLQASQNQEKEPFLPQISKSYLRIKDGRMTIRLVIKYLVNKLKLENESESEIEIRCKGQRLVPMLTLQHVRDNIWSSPRDFITLLPNSSTTDHIMVLHYARTISN